MLDDVVSNFMQVTDVLVMNVNSNRIMDVYTYITVNRNVKNNVDTDDKVSIMDYVVLEPHNENVKPVLGDVVNNNEHYFVDYVIFDVADVNVIMDFVSVSMDVVTVKMGVFNWYKVDVIVSMDFAN